MSERERIYVEGVDDYSGVAYTQRREEIVRCRDCKHYLLDPKPIDPGLPMYCRDTGRDMLEPDGFCAWGEKGDNG